MSDPAPCRHAGSISGQLQLAVEAAAAAGRVLADHYGSLATVEQKDVGDLVSQVDRDADQAATEVLRRGSELPILSEELHPDVPEQSGSMWIVDPLDGSSAYLMQAGPQYPAVLVAARHDGVTHLGVVFFPLTNDWYYAQRGRGAWRNGRRLLCGSSEELSDVWVEMNQYGNARWETPFFQTLRDQLRTGAGARLVTTNVPNSGVAMRIAGGTGPLAVAVHDNHPGHVKQGPWDIAAPQIILEEAGGVFLSPQGTATDPFRAEPIIVARSRSLAEQVLELVSRQPVK